jgi:drug/metabolite transporter (DMT)-like permease
MTAIAGGKSGAFAGPLLMALAILVFVAMDAAVKYLSGGYVVTQILCVRAGVALILVLAAAALLGWRKLRMQRPGLHALRAVLLVLSASTFFYAFRYLPLADAYAIAYLAPLVSTLLAALVLKEPVPRGAGWAIGLGLAGVGVVLAPQLQGGALWAYGICFIGVLAYSANGVTTRRMAGGESLLAMMLYPAIAMLAVTLPLMPWHWTAPSPSDLAVLMAIGVMWPAGSLLVVAAMRRAAVARVAPVDYTSIVWVVLVDTLLFGLSPSLATLAGSGIIIVACLTLLYRTR